MPRPAAFRLLPVLFLLSTCAAGGEFARVIKLRQDQVDGKQFKAAPGEVIGIEAGRRDTLFLQNFQGTKEEPIVFMNAGGLVEVENGDRGFAIVLHNCRNVRFTGTGDPNHKYGIRAKTTKPGMNTFSVGLSWDFEVDHVEVSGAGFAGFNIKSEPSADGSTNRDTYTMTNAVLHDNYVHDTKGEGFYVGHTFFNGYSDKGKTLMPHVIKGLRIHHNLCRNNGCEGIQVGSAVEDVKIHDNIVENPGREPFDKWQNNGVQIGIGTTGEFYNNLILNAPAQGLIIWGSGDNYVYNNVIVNAGGCGIYCMDKGVPQSVGYRFVNNTIVDPGGEGIFLNLEKVERAEVRNNLIVKSSKGSYLVLPNGKIKCTAANNLQLKSADEAGFLDAAKNDFRLQPASRARNAGVPFAELPIAFDFAMNPRPVNGPCDVGAFQYADPNAKPSAPATKAAAKAAPPIPAKLTPKEGALAKWDQKLLARLKASLAAGARHRVTIAAQRKQFTVTGVEKDAQLVLQADGGSLPVPFSLLELSEKTDLARSLARAGEPEDHALCAFYLLASGKAEEATEHLDQAAAGRQEVEESFQP